MGSTCTTNEYGKIWKNEKGEIHREDGPAVEWPDGDWWWYLNGKCHRICGPCDWFRGEYYWWVNGESVIYLVGECLAKAPDLPVDIHLGILARKMLQLNDDRLWRIIKPWL